ncbi:hypothetical protein HLB23_33320 [Nocardia uniformis]|uniref:Uncharacterized protein n=1 Tax=Nocardia uniformis TaxID=53432 RepID=A0A849CDX8_9NOCA|nr:hypothetical protein [Nocardia uniformis]NNH74675.1 hypothetical protein [Nocardia uniformis]
MAILRTATVGIDSCCPTADPAGACRNIRVRPTVGVVAAQVGDPSEYDGVLLIEVDAAVSAYPRHPGRLLAEIHYCGGVDSGQKHAGMTRWAGDIATPIQ